MNKNLLFGLLSVAILLIGGGVWYYLAFTPTSYSVTETPKAVLTQQNQDYADAVAYAKAGKHDLALQSYEKALLLAEDETQAAQIRINIAVTNEKLHNYAAAIAGFKAIAASTTSYPTARAYAVQEMGLMYYTFVGTDDRKTITAETFKDAPYDSFWTSDNVNLSYTKLFEYATSFYPLGPSEARIAYGYANEIIGTFKGATTTPQAKAYLTTIMQSIQAADAGVNRMKGIPEEALLIPETLIRAGTALSILVPVGAASPEQAEPYFRAGVAYSTTLGYKLGSFNTFNYAAFLVDQYGAKRSADIQTLLLPFRVGNDAQIYPNIVTFFRTARTDTTLAKSRAQLVKMGRIDAGFKTYLISLGWKDSDF